jgi:uncharacterized Ntn-hydrolase superfamily protein
MQALEAAQATGGDNRGRCSAAIRVFGNELYAYLDARVDDYADPVPELRRLIEIAKGRRTSAAYYTTRLDDMPELAALADRRQLSTVGSQLIADS